MPSPFFRLSLLLYMILPLAGAATAREAHSGTPSTSVAISGTVEQRLAPVAALAALAPAQVVAVSLPRSPGSAPVRYRGANKIAP